MIFLIAELFVYSKENDNAFKDSEILINELEERVKNSIERKGKKVYNYSIKQYGDNNEKTIIIFTDFNIPAFPELRRRATHFFNCSHLSKSS